MTISQFMSDIQECNNQLKALKQHLVDEVQCIVNEMTPRVSEFLLIYEEAIDKLSDSDFTPVSTNTIGDDFFIKRGIYSEYDESSPSYSIGLLDSFCLLLDGKIMNCYDDHGDIDSLNLIDLSIDKLHSLKTALSHLDLYMSEYYASLNKYMSTVKSEYQKLHVTTSVIEDTIDLNDYESSDEVIISHDVSITEDAIENTPTESIESDTLESKDVQLNSEESIDDDSTAEMLSNEQLFDADASDDNFASDSSESLNTHSIEQSSVDEPVVDTQELNMDSDEFSTDDFDNALSHEDASDSIDDVLSLDSPTSVKILEPKPEKVFDVPCCIQFTETCKGIDMSFAVEFMPDIRTNPYAQFFEATFPLRDKSGNALVSFIRKRCKLVNDDTVVISLEPSSHYTVFLPNNEKFVFAMDEFCSFCDKEI